MIEVVTGILILLGGAFALIASIGLVRLPDVLIRMHAATKVGTLASGLIMAAVVLHFADVGIVVRVVAIIVFLLLTAPIAAHMVGRATIRSGLPLWTPDKEEER